MNAINSNLTNWGNKLFLFRRWFYLIPILFIVGIENDEFIFNDHAMQEMFEAAGIMVALFGIILRFWASGSSRRNILRKKTRRVPNFETKGIFSVIRNPYFLGDLLIILGLSVPLFQIHLIVVSVILFLAVTIPQLIAREELLRSHFGEAYASYTHKTHLIVPSFKNWHKGRASYSWRAAFLKEGNVFVTIGVLFFFIEQFRDFYVEGSLDLSPGWVIFITIFIFVFIMLRLFDPDAENIFTDSMEFPD